MERRHSARALAIASSAILAGALVAACTHDQGAPPEATGGVPAYGSRGGAAAGPPSILDGGGDGSSPDTLTCAWLRGPNNCWATVLGEIKQCAPTGVATYDVQLSACIYASGVGAHFSSGLQPDFPWKKGDTVAFVTIDPNATSACINFSTTYTSPSGGGDYRAALSTPKHTALVERVGDVVGISCDGVIVTTSHSSQIAQECGGFPGVEFPGGPTDPIDLIPGPPAPSTAGKQRVFECRSQ